MSAKKLAEDIAAILDGDCDATRIALYNPRVTVASIRERIERELLPQANGPDDGPRCYRFSFGAYGDTSVIVYAGGEESAFEIAVEWLDDNAPGHLVAIGEAELKEAADELVLPLDYDDEDSLRRITERAEQDLTIIGHTTLAHGQYLCSWEWTFVELPL